MAVAAHTPAIWNEVLSTTLHNMHGKLVDNVFRKRPLLEHLLSNGRVRIEDGGYSIVEHLLFNEGQADSYGEWDLITVKSAGVVYEVDPSVGRVGQAVRAWSSGSVTSSTTQVSTAWARARTSSPR